MKVPSWLVGAVRPEAPRLVGAALLGAAAQLAGLSAAGGLAWLIARAAEPSQPPSSALPALPALAVILAILAARLVGAGRAGLRFAERILGEGAAYRVMARAQLRVYLDLERAGPSAATRLRRGDVLARVVGDVGDLQALLVKGILPYACLGLTGLAAAIGLTFVAPTAGLVLAAGLAAVLVLVPFLLLRSATRAERLVGPARAELAAPVLELLGGVAELTAYRATDRWLERVRRRDGELTALSRRTSGNDGFAGALVVLATGATVLAELAVGLLAIRSGGLDPLWVVVLAIVPLVVFEPAGALPDATRAVVTGLAAARHLAELEGLPALSVAEGEATLPDHSLALEAHAVTVRWPGADEPTLQDVSFRLEPGRRIGIVGDSGAGKSTLIDALLGFLPVESGEVRLGGIPLPDLDERALRGAVTVCAQDSHLFDATIRDNLLVAYPDAEADELTEALRRARMWDWVRELPAGLDTPVGESGVRLSGGERQRLALARALLADPAVLLLDEPTAHLDEPTAAALMRDLLVATAGRTTVLVTHRLAGLSVVDEVIVLSGGRVVQRGTPTELMEQPGAYRTMWFRAASSASSLTGLSPTSAGAR